MATRATANHTNLVGNEAEYKSLLHITASYEWTLTRRVGGPLNVGAPHLRAGVGFLKSKHYRELDSHSSLTANNPCSP